jgi:hypothetical protein
MSTIVHSQEVVVQNEGNSNFKITTISFTPCFLRNKKVEGDSNENGRK